MYILQRKFSYALLQGYGLELIQTIHYIFLFWTVSMTKKTFLVFGLVFILNKYTFDSIINTISIDIKKRIAQ